MKGAVGEPTGMNIVVSHKGVADFEALVHGGSYHASIPHEGANAVVAAAAYAQALERELKPRLKQREQKLVGHATLNVGLIKGGTTINMVPDGCSVHIDRRRVDGENQEQVIGELEGILQEACSFDPRLHTEIRSLLPENGCYGPFLIEEKHQLVSLTGRPWGGPG